MASLQTMSVNRDEAGYVSVTLADEHNGVTFQLGCLSGDTTEAQIDTLITHVQKVLDNSDNLRGMAPGFAAQQEDLRDQLYSLRVMSEQSAYEQNWSSDDTELSARDINLALDINSIINICQD